MTEEQIINGNKLIAQFMGAEYIRKKDFFEERFIENMYYAPGVFRDMAWDGTNNVGVQTPVVALLYHRYWDWLIPACKKAFDISSSQDRPSINHCNKLDWLESEISCHLREYNQEAVFLSLVEFVKHYNQSTAIGIAADTPQPEGRGVEAESPAIAQNPSS